MAINFNKIANFFNGTALNQLAKNFTDIAEEFPKTLYRDGSNTMRGNLDMDGRRIINHGYPLDDTDLATLRQVKDYTANITQGPPGAADNTYTSYAALLASDPSRRSARLVGDPVEPDGIFSYKDGQWVRQKADSVQFQRPGSNKVMDLQTKAALTVHIEDFGAVADGFTDSTAAFELAFNTLPNGQRIQLQPGKYILKRTLIWKKAFALMGAGREQCEIHFASDGNYLTCGVGGPRAANIFLHPSVVGINGYDGQPVTGYAGRSTFHGVKFSGDSTMQANTTGMFVAAPIYGYESDVVSFTNDGIYISAGNDRPTRGNANGCTFTNVNSQLNAQSGFSLVGNDVNRCILTGCNAAGNGLHGYYDDTIIGNSYISCEADGNGGTGYICIRETTRSKYDNCYSETPPFFNLTNRCILVGMQGNISPTRSYGGSYFGGMPSGDTLLYRPVVVAESEVIGNVMGDASAPGKAFRVSENGIDWRLNPGQELTQLTSAGSPNYLRLSVAGTQSALWCAMDVTGNLRKGVQWATGGLAFGVNSAIVGSGSTPPSASLYVPGAIFLNENPTAGGKIGWVLTSAGWKTWGAIDS